MSGTYTLYDRKWRIIVTGVNGSAPIFDSLPGVVSGTTGAANALDLSQLRCTFRIEQNYAQSWQMGEVTIYNLNPQTETAIFKNGQRVIIEAGYQNGPYGEIYSGVVFQPLRGKEDATTNFIKLVCIDGLTALSLGFCGFSMGAGQTAEDIAKQVCRASEIPFAISVDPNLSKQKTQRGKVVFGQPGPVLRSIAKNNDASFFFQGGSAKIEKLKKQPVSDQVVQINVKTGMIGMPRQVDFGMRVQCLINPKIKCGNFIEINNQDLQLQQTTLGNPFWVPSTDGLYRVVSLVATGDTRGNDWYYDMETVSQKGGLPDLLYGPFQSGF